MSNDKIIPFGKYKGQEIEQVMQRDPQWVRWIMQQAWFQQKYPTLNQVVINVFAPPSEDTPAHNAIQVRFLEFDYRDAFWRATALMTDQDLAGLRRSYREFTADLRKAPRAREHVRDRHFDNWRRKDHREKVARQWKLWRHVHQEPEIEVIIDKPKFENISDVTFNVCVRAGYFEGEHIEVTQRYRLAIEIKPSMGDDYPAVLRQIKQQKIAARFHDERPTHWFLLLDQFAARAVTLDQVRAIFALDDISIVLAAQLP